MNRFIVLFLMVFTGIAASFAPNAHAFQIETETSQPGCSPEFWQIQQVGGLAESVRTIAAAKEIINPPSSVNALTCFDQAMMQSAKAGQIFSDRPPSSLPTFNPLTALGLGSSLGGPFGAGTTDILANQLQSVVDPVLGNLLSGFTNALSSVLGSTLTSAFSGVLGNLTASIPGLSGIMGGIMGQSMNCSVMQDLWDGQIVGQGLDDGYSFISYADLVNRNAPGWGTNAAAQLIANQDILDRARNDQQNLLTPGYFPFNPIVPIFSPNASVQDIINGL